ncbi:MAG TPA: hypothetical protein DET67_09260 [Ruegeria sp.]|nr:hypothetical protein [Ruegeria sp.]
MCAMFNPLNAPPQGVEMLKSPPREIDEAEIDQFVQAVMRQEAAAPKPRKTLPEIAPAVPEAAASEESEERKPRYQPKWRHSAAILALALLIGWPGLLVALLGLAVVVPVIAYLTLGHDRASECVAAAFARFRRLDPVRAEILRGWAMRRVAGVERVLSWLPERWTSGLYLPDLRDTPVSHDKMRLDPFSRFQAEQAETPDAG